MFSIFVWGGGTNRLYRVPSSCLGGAAGRRSPSKKPGPTLRHWKVKLERHEFLLLRERR